MQWKHAHLCDQIAEMQNKITALEDALETRHRADQAEEELQRRFDEEPLAEPPPLPIRRTFLVANYTTFRPRLKNPLPSWATANSPNLLALRPMTRPAISLKNSRKLQCRLSLKAEFSNSP